MDNYELVIIGAGAAGLAAGIYGARSGLTTLVLDDKIAGGTTAEAPLVENYLGFQKISGIELARKMVDHCRSSGAAIREFESVTSMDIKGENKTVTTHKTSYEAKAIIIATGSHYRQIGVPGEKEFRGKGVSYCGICDGPLFKNKRVLVVGGGNSAVITALYLADLASEVKITHRRDTFRAEEALVKALNAKKNTEVLWENEVKEIKGEKLVNKVVLLSNKTGHTAELQVDGVFVQVGESPNSQIAKEAGVETDDNCYIKVDVTQRTNIPKVYAAGDVTNTPVEQIGTAVGQGIIAALSAYRDIRRPYYHREQILP
jgi:thioredoxin reductase (NADPH)